MGIIAPRLKELKLIDSIIPEPLGGAHRNPEVMAASLKAQLLADLADLDVLSKDDLKKPSLPASDELRLRVNCINSEKGHNAVALFFTCGLARL